jgi:DNA-directed RNA polymerase subunit RPC12/RpoP
MKTENNLNCPNCGQKFSLFLMWFKQIKLNKYKCSSCNELSTYKNVTRKYILIATISVIVFFGFSFLLFKFTELHIGFAATLPGLLTLPMGLFFQLYLSQNHVLTLVSSTANKPFKQDF